MKFQPTTNAVTPIHGYSNAYYHDNKYIPSKSIKDFDSPTKGNDNSERNGRTVDDNCSGRIVRYETITVTSPVLSSARLMNQRKKGRCIITKDDVDELNSKLQSLLLRDGEEEEKEEIVANTAGQTKSKATNISTELTKEEQRGTTTYFGRCSMVIYNTVTNDFVQVIRSARLAFTSSK